jgi:DNA-binding transcriptional ArsR family regulator
LEIIINYIPAGGQIYDLIYTISAHFNFGSVSILHKMNGHIAENYFDNIFADLNDLIKSKPQGIDVFFQYFTGGPCCMTLFFMKMLWDFKTPAGFIRYFSEIDDNELRAKVLEYYDEYKSNDDVYKEMLTDNVKLIEFVCSFHISTIFRNNLISFFKNPKPFVKNITEIMTYALNKMRAVLRYKKSEIEGFIASSFSLLEKDSCVLSLENNPFVVNLTEQKIIKFTVCVINDAVLYVSQSEDQIRICFGINYEQYPEESLEYTETIDLQLVAKALGEDIRYKIFNMVNKNEMYMSEIAASLELPAPAICYHINLLIRAKLIKTTIKGRKTYYSINRKQLNAVFKFLKISYSADDNNI